jgi:hypothetical protein
MRTQGCRTLFRSPQPRKLGIQSGNRSRCRFRGWMECSSALRLHRGGRGRHGHLGAANSLVTAVSSAAPCAQEAKLLWGLVKEDVGIVGHAVPLNDHSSREWRREASPIVLVSGDFIRRVFKEMQENWSGPADD